MRDSGIVGTRIRQRRVTVGLRQAELAKAAGISASYLNLIEHNRRRIGGKTLLQIAEVLKVEPSVLSQGAEASLLAALHEAAVDVSGADETREVPPEVERIEEFAGRFPGWAGLLADLSRQRDGLESTVKALTERLAHDPQLSATLHEVISTVTSIRSTASILAETRELEPEWQMRFHRNINEDGARLAEGAEALMRYLEAAPEAGAEVTSPQDELHAFLEQHGYHFPQLEGWGAEPRVDGLIGASKAIKTASARTLARDVLAQYVEDARALPLDAVQAAIKAHGVAPDAIAQETARPMAQVFRRLAMLPDDMVGPVGLVVVDGAGALLVRKPVMGFATPRSGAGCTLWPVYEVLGQPGRPVLSVLEQGGLRLQAMAVAEQILPAGFERPALLRAVMLLLPETPGQRGDTARGVGVTCRICPLKDCGARREPSILADGF